MLKYFSQLCVLLILVEMVELGLRRKKYYEIRNSRQRDMRRAKAFPVFSQSVIIKT